jgi:hypothetical protein
MRNIVMCRGFAWLIIMDSGFDDWVYWHFSTIALNSNSSHIEILLNDFSLTNLSLISLCPLSLIWISRIHECTEFYICYAAGVEVTMSYSSSVLLCYDGNAFVSIRCYGNKCLPSRCLAKVTSSSGIISVFGQCLPSRWLAVGHSLSHSTVAKHVFQRVPRLNFRHI